VPRSRLDQLRALELERDRLLHQVKPVLEARWLRAMGDVQLEVVALEVELTWWSAIHTRLREGLASGAMPTLAEAQEGARATLHRDFARLERWRREVAAAQLPPAVGPQLRRPRAPAQDQPYGAAREVVTAAHAWDLPTAIAALERELEALRSAPPFTYATLLDDPTWIAEQRAQLEGEVAALRARRDRERQLAELLVAGPLG
jgi:hypothetical protein